MMLKQLVVASHNAGKVREIADLLRPLGLAVQAAGDLGLPEPEETETTFVGNALLKARAAASASGLPALADDSGLCVAALGGEPGIYSARWAGPEKDFALAMHKVWAAVMATGSANHQACFTCVLALAFPDGRAETFAGQVDGTLVWPPRGAKGFGYDPMFIPAGHSITFAEMDPVAKHAISHRAKAFAQFLAWTAQQYA
jgi:XTP/dITP diphosphohydrolase